MYYTDYLSRRIRRRKIIIASIAVFICLPTLLIVLYFSSYTPERLINTRKYEDVSCHYATEGDALPAIDDQSIASTNSIFFHETSCRGRLNSRQACSIESAARSQPDWQIHVLFSAPIDKLSLGDVNIELLKLMKNVFFWRLHLEDYAKGTPLEKSVSSGALNKTLWPMSETSGMLKYLTLYKWGGVCLDFDLIVAKPLGGLGGNWAVRESPEIVGSSAMAFRRDTVGTLVSDAAVRKLAEIFNRFRSFNGKDIESVLKDVCFTDIVSNKTADKCLGFKVYPPELMHKLRRDLYLQLPSDEGIEPNENAYFYQIISRWMHDGPVDRDSKYAKLAKRYCPIVYENYRTRFGI